MSELSMTPDERKSAAKIHLIEAMMRQLGNQPQGQMAGRVYVGPNFAQQAMPLVGGLLGMYAGNKVLDGETPDQQNALVTRQATMAKINDAITKGDHKTAVTLALTSGDPVLQKLGADVQDKVYSPEEFTAPQITGEGPVQYGKYGAELRHPNVKMAQWEDAGTTGTGVPLQQNLVTKEKKSLSGGTTVNLNTANKAQEAGWIESSKNIANDLQKGSEEIRKDQTTLGNLSEARGMLDQGINSGITSTPVTVMEKLYNTFVGPTPNDFAANTEAYRALITKTIGTQAKEIGGAQLSNADTALAQKAIAGDTSLEPAAMKRLVDITMAGHVNNISNYQKRLESAMVGKMIPPEAGQYFFSGITDPSKYLEGDSPFYMDEKTGRIRAKALPGTQKSAQTPSGASSGQVWTPEHEQELQNLREWAKTRGGK